MKPTAIIIARCSTTETKQDVTRQVKDLSEAYSGPYEILNIFSYYKSGLDNDVENEEIINYVQIHQIKNIIVTEVSRISRKISSFSIFLEKCNSLKVNVIIDNYKLHTFLNEKENTMAQAMLQIAAVMARNELELTKDRLNSGRRKYISDGGKLGRNSGSVESTEQFLKKYPVAIRFIKKGRSIREVMKLCNLSNGTVQKLKMLIT